MNRPEPTEKQIEAAWTVINSDWDLKTWNPGVSRDVVRRALSAALAVEAGAGKLDWSCNEARSPAGDLYSVSALSETVWVTYWNGTALPGWKSTRPEAMAVAQSHMDGRAALTTPPASSAVGEAVAPLGYASAYGLEKLASKAHHYCLSLTKKPENEFQCPIYAAPTPAGEWREALQKIADMRWAEDADLDDICTIADRALASPAPHQEGRK